MILLFALRVIPDLFESYSRKKGKTIRRSDRGADAEEDIAGLLVEPSDEFVVLHDVESPYGNIDHIVISQKRGIFLLENKSRHGTVTTTEREILVNGRCFNWSSNIWRSMSPLWPRKSDTGTTSKNRNRRRSARSCRAIDLSALFIVPMITRLAGTPNSNPIFTTNELPMTDLVWVH